MGESTFNVCRNENGLKTSLCTLGEKRAMFTQEHQIVCLYSYIYYIYIAIYVQVAPSLIKIDGGWR
jgi:hypothetical protein